jgi:hypothetical protein|tara:strand:+ start:1591 stop:1902 length:312 start_codon:yes stop_codon:yes gene_type:complete
MRTAKYGFAGVGQPAPYLGTTGEIRVPEPRIATLGEIINAIPDDEYIAWENDTSADARKKWNTFHAKQEWTPTEWDAAGDSLESGGFLTAPQNEAFKLEKPKA